MGRRFMILAVFTLASSAMFAGALHRLITSADRGDYYSHIPLIPLVSAYLMYSERKKIFRDPQYSLVPGILLVLAGILDPQSQ